jgi:hypothetical protein
MTREEKAKAIDTLKLSAPIKAVTQEEFNTYIQTINQVMDWLEQELCDEAISRQAVLDLAKKGVLISNGNYKSVCKAINELPSVNPQPKTGHWLMPDKEYSSKIWRKCSCCGTHIEKYSKHISFDGEVHYIPYRLNYCYVCGTRMVESQKSEEV